MKKIINGKRYDTDKARMIGEDSYSNPRDFSYWCETLYQKRTGEFFLYGEGGPASKYAESRGQNTWGGGSKIIPLSYNVAKKWAEDHLDADTYENLFDVIEDTGEMRTKISYYTKLKSGEIEELVIVSAEEAYNSGIFWMTDGRLYSFDVHSGTMERTDLTPEIFDAHVTEMFSEGAHIYGRGCTK